MADRKEIHEATESELVELRRKVAFLEQSNEELRSFLRAMNDIMLVTDWEGRYLTIAPTSPELLYKPGPELLGKTMHEVFAKDLADSFLSSVRCAIETQQGVSLEYSIPLEGREVWFIAHIAPMPGGRALFVARDNTDRKRMEEAVRTQHEELIRAQAAALAELSTPLIPISEDIVVMPLIGLFDPGRANQVMHTLLAGVSQTRAQVAILDITGMSMVDTQVANGLLRAARAAQLLGAEVVLTGIRPEVARTLVSLGADLVDIATRGTLQSGIAYAMERRGSSTARGG